MANFSNLDLLSGGSLHPNSTKILRMEEWGNGTGINTAVFVKFADGEEGAFFVPMSAYAAKTFLNQTENKPFPLEFVCKDVIWRGQVCKCTGSVASCNQYILTMEDGTLRYVNPEDLTLASL